METIDLAKEILIKKIPDIIGIYVYGSYATERQTSESDLDIAIYSKTLIDPVKLYEIAQEIASSINTDVDLIDLKDTSDILAFQIINEGKRVYCTDEDQLNMLENTIDSKYIRLSETIEPIVEDIKKRKKVF